MLLNKILYNQAGVHTIWFKKLNTGSEYRHFDPSDYDPCLFISNKVVYLVYVDGCLWFSKYRKYIDGAIKYSRKEGSQYKWEMTQ